MKKFIKILTCIFSIITMILSVVFIVIEGRLVFSLEWIIYDNPFNGLIRYLFRLIIALFIFIKSILEIVHLNKNKEYLFFMNLLCVLSSVIIVFFASNYIGVIMIILSIVLLILQILKIKFLKG